MSATAADTSSAAAAGTPEMGPAAAAMAVPIDAPIASSCAAAVVINSGDVSRYDVPHPPR